MQTPVFLVSPLSHNSIYNDDNLQQYATKNQTFKNKPETQIGLALIWLNFDQHSPLLFVNHRFQLFDDTLILCHRIISLLIKSYKINYELDARKLSCSTVKQNSKNCPLVFQYMQNGLKELESYIKFKIH